MRPELRSFRVNHNYLIGANLGLRIIIFHPDVRTVAYDVDFQANADDHFFLSQDGRLLAGAFSSESFCCVEVISLLPHMIIPAESRENATILRIDRLYALDVGLSPNGETLFYWKHGEKPGAYAVHLNSRKLQKIPDAASVTNGAWLKDRVIFPCDESGGIVVYYWPQKISHIELPSKANVWRLIEHPITETIAMLDTEDQIASVHAESMELIWKRRIPEADWISYSGDGRFIAVLQRAPNGGQAERIVMLDAGSGEAVRVIEQPEEQALYPLDGPRFLCYSGRFVNAETGEFEEGVSAPGFWDQILKR
jgi:hypothetical protein